MKIGGGTVAVERLGVKEINDGRPFAVGKITETFKKYQHFQSFF